MFADMSKVYGCDDPQKLYPDVLNKNTVVKAQMAEWLFSAIYLLDRCCLPSRIEYLQEEKIADQKEVIELQKKLISKKDGELGHVSKTVEDGLKSYSSVLQQSCTTALSPKNIATAVKKIAKEDDRSKEVVVFGVDEETGECPANKVAGILEQLEEKPMTSGCRRIGQRVTGATRPLIFSVRSTDIIYTFPNRTLDERRRKRHVVD